MRRPQGGPDQGYLTVEEFASGVGMSLYTVRQWIKRRWIAASMPGGKRIGYRIPAVELQRVLRDGVQPPVPPPGRTLLREAHGNRPYVHTSRRADGTTLDRLMSPRPLLRGLKRVRLTRALTQEQLAQAALLDVLTVSRLERLQNPATTKTRRALADALRVLPELLEQENPSVPEDDLPAVSP